jgi:hypothetical protein
MSSEKKAIRLQSNYLPYPSNHMKLISNDNFLT